MVCLVLVGWVGGWLENLWPVALIKMPIVHALTPKLNPKFPESQKRDDCFPGYLAPNCVSKRTLVDAPPVK